MAAKKTKKTTTTINREMRLIIQAHAALQEVIQAPMIGKVSVWESTRRRANRPNPRIVTDAHAALGSYLKQMMQTEPDIED